jgi:triosephosphate isomerase
METLTGADIALVPAPFEGGRRPLVVANWKMNFLSAQLRDYATTLNPHVDSGVEVALCPSTVWLAMLREALGEDTQVRLGAQDLHPEASGAHTGEHGGPMLRDAGARFVIVGHSERRSMGEDDPLIGRKVRAALAASLCPILCVGERLAEREDGATLRVLRNQLTVTLSGLRSRVRVPGDLVLAYEPVWAIGTGRHATPEQAQEAAAFLRDRLAELLSHAFADKVRILYGGSVSADNAAGMAAGRDVDGFLVGTAGLDPVGFSEIIAVTGRVKAAGMVEGV